MTHFEKVPPFPYTRTQKFEAACFLNLIFRRKGMNLHSSPQASLRSVQTGHRRTSPALHLKIQLLTDMSALQIHFFKLWWLSSLPESPGGIQRPLGEASWDWHLKHHQLWSANTLVGTWKGDSRWTEEKEVQVGKTKCLLLNFPPGHCLI